MADAGKTEYERILALEQWKAETQNILEAWRRDNEFALENGRAAVGFAQTFFNSLVLITGGAFVAMLAFIGARPESAAAAKAMSLPLTCLVIAAGFAVVAPGISFLAQEQFGLSEEDGDSHSRRGHSGRIAATIFAFISLGLDGWAALEFLNRLSAF